ncbi:MAG TPA: acyltransferase [Pyrinomonadaceae bacterium]|jgi:peptidoglycan/LPS O-acetylase OafA/YrhL|nr:acyltransferase [Pyrinomonadaceae bacterium]
MHSVPQRIPSLDGLRALSIALVIIGHAYQGATNTSPTTPVWLIVGNAALGVEIFFVLSGFLITSLLLQEHRQFGTISLSGFYLRRAFRILPPLWTFLIVVLFLGMAGLIRVKSGGMLSALTFTTNYSPWAGSASLDHTWSLSVEEQFYLLWPIALGVLLKRRGRGAAAKLAFALVILAPIFRVLSHFSGSEFLASRVYWMLHTRMDALMFGCLLALVSKTEQFERFYDSVRPWIAPTALFVLFVSPLLMARFGGVYTYCVGYSIEGACIALSIWWLIVNSNSKVGKVFNLSLVAHVGVISYSLYLWQELMLKSELAITRVTPVALLFLFAAAEMSFLLIERPFLRLRRRSELHLANRAIPEPVSDYLYVE